MESADRITVEDVLADLGWKMPPTQDDSARAPRLLPLFADD